MNPRLLIAAVVLVLLGLGGAVRTYLALENQAYHPPVRSTEVAPGGSPRDQAIVDIAKANETKAKAKKYEPPAYRTFPVVGSRVAVWVVAQLHLMFAAFVLAVPMFAFIIELIGYFNGDPRYNRLAYEFAKLLSSLGIGPK